MSARRIVPTLVAGLLTVASCSSTGPSTVESSAGSAVPADADTPDTTTAVTSPSTTASSTTSPAGSDENDPELGTVVSVEPSVVDGGVVPEGFSVTMARVTKADGEVCEVCMWLADDAVERGRGLMGVTSLGQGAAMVFVFDRPTMGQFFMFQTLTPLSIAWVSPAGVVLSSDDMEPCTSLESTSCERYGPDAEYEMAIEVFLGDLDDIGLVAGATVELIDGTEAADCSLAAASLAG